MNSSFKCPACDKPLSWGIEMDKGASVHQLWCANNECAFGFVAAGDSEAEAFKNLDAEFDRELEKHPKDYT